MACFFLLLSAEKKSTKESPLKREVQAVKSILQGGTSRDHHSHHVEGRQTRDDKKTHQKKRNLLEVFKKPSNAKDIEKTVKRPHVIDKFDLECLEILKVRGDNLSSVFAFVHSMFSLFNSRVALENFRQC